MLRALLPREVGFFDFFERQAELTKKAAAVMVELSKDGGGRIQELARSIKEIEHQGDQVTHDCIAALHKTFITPLDRNDIHTLTSTQDDVLDFIDSVARMIALYQVGALREELGAAAGILAEATTVVERAVRGLRNMKNAEKILGEVKHLSKLEKDADAVHARAVARLYKDEKDPISVMKWREIHEAMESAIDACDDVGNVIEGIVLEHA